MGEDFEYFFTKICIIQSYITSISTVALIGLMTELNYRSRVKAYWRQNGIEGFSTHSLRHGAASHMLKNKAPLHGISAFLGHKDISSTEVYTKVNPLDVRGVIDKMIF